jgi:hypothetical protein
VDFAGIFAMRGRVVALDNLAAEVEAAARDLARFGPPGFLGADYGALWVPLRLAHMAKVDVIVSKTHTWADVLKRVGASRTFTFPGGGRVEARCKRQAAALELLMDLDLGALPVHELLDEANKHRAVKGKARITALDLSISECLG